MYCKYSPIYDLRSGCHRVVEGVVSVERSVHPPVCTYPVGDIPKRSTSAGAIHPAFTRKKHYLCVWKKHVSRSPDPRNETYLLLKLLIHLNRKNCS